MKTPVEQAIERAMARIGCPPGDNSDADLYNELAAALASMKTESPAPSPLVSDEQIKPPAVWRANSWSGRMEVITPKGITSEEVRAIYESELTKMRAERDELVGALEGIMELAYSSRLDVALDEARDILSKYKTE